MSFDPLHPEELATEREARLRQEQTRKDEADADFKWLMDSERGRRLVWRVLEASGVFRCTYVSGMKDATSEMLFREGAKNIGYRVLADIQSLCPDKYLLMIKEHNDGRND